MKTALSLSLILAAGLLEAGDLYLAPADAPARPGDGTARRPFASLTQARDAIRAARRAGDRNAWTVHLAKGDYPVSAPVVFEPCDSGSADAPITYAGEGADTRIMGGIRIGGWAEAPEGYWVADIPALPDGSRAYFESLYVNGRRAVRARHPNAGFFSPQALKQTILTNAAPRAEYAKPPSPDGPATSRRSPARRGKSCATPRWWSITTGTPRAA